MFAASGARHFATADGSEESEIEEAAPPPTRMTPAQLPGSNIFLARVARVVGRPAATLAIGAALLRVHRGCCRLGDLLAGPRIEHLVQDALARLCSPHHGRDRASARDHSRGRSDRGLTRSLVEDEITRRLTAARPLTQTCRLQFAGQPPGVSRRSLHPRHHTPPSEPTLVHRWVRAATAARAARREWSAF